MAISKARQLWKGVLDLLHDDANAAAARTTLDVPKLSGESGYTGVHNFPEGNLQHAGGVVQRIKTYSAVDLSSGSPTEADFTAIPSWAKEITINFSGTSANGTDDILVQIGDSGGLEVSGYTSASSDTAGNVTSTAGFIIFNDNATHDKTGQMTLSLTDTNEWVSSHINLRDTGGVPALGAGNKTLSGTLDRLRIKLTATNTFDAGKVNIVVKG